MSRDDDGLKFGFMLILLGGGMLWSSLKRKKRARRFEDIQRNKISSAPQGYVELSGFAWPEKFIPGVDGKGIAYLSWRLEKYVKRGKRGDWEVVAKGSKPSGFLINDETGSVWVDMCNADFDCKIRYEKWHSISDTLKNLYLNLMGTISVSGFPPSGFFADNFRIGLCEIHPGCPVVAQGHLNSSGIVNSRRAIVKGFATFKERYLKFLKNPAYKMSMLDTDQDGEVSEEEHRIGHVYSAGATVRKAQTDLSSQEESVNVLGILKHTENYALVVANTHEVYLLNRLKRWSSVGILGGALLIAAGASLLYFEFFEHKILP